MTIKIDFEFETQHGKFSDALHLPDDHNFTEEEIQAMKEQQSQIEELKNIINVTR